MIDSNPPKEAYLSVGNLLNKFCIKHGCEPSELKGILDKFFAKLNDCKNMDRKFEDTIVATLKGIRNIRHLPSPERVLSCISEKHTTRVRVSALQTLAIAACQKKVQQQMLSLLKDRNADSELRIEAYLALISCPSGTLANEIKTVLDEETVHQVGSFITSHLASLRSSTDSYRELARQHFANVRTNQKFLSDLRQYSFNHEFSYAIDSMGVGASVDTTVIYSQNSFLPRSGRLNVTGEIFGKNFNIFELSARQENIDLLLEHNFGPKGLFNTATSQELYDMFTNTVADKGNVGTRGRRSLRTDITQFNKIIKTSPKKENLRDIELDISLKLFGSEMYFLSLGDDLPLDPKDFIKKLKAIGEKLLTSAKGFDEIYEFRSLFLDAELVYPTGIGFPLRLIAHGAGATRIEAGGKFDLKEILRNPRETKVLFRAVPSYNLDISGELVVDGFAVTTGLHTGVSVHSSTGAEIDFRLLDSGRGFDTKVRFPFKKQEVLTFDHKIVSVTQERGYPSIETNLKFSSKQHKLGGSFDQLKRFTGMTLSTEVTVTQPGTVNVAPFPLNGPLHAHVWLEVETEYQLTANFKQDNDKNIVIINFNTPGSAENRASTLTLEGAIKPKLFARATLETPGINMGIETGLIKDEKDIAIFATYTQSSNVHYSAKLGFTKSGAAPKEIYTPIAEFKTPSKSENSIHGYKVTGQVVLDTSKGTHRFNFENIQVVGNDPDPFSVNGFIEYSIDSQKGKISGDVELSKGNKQGSIKGGLELIPNPKTVNFDLGIKNNVVDIVNGKIDFKLDHSTTHVSKTINTFTYNFILL